MKLVNAVRAVFALLGLLLATTACASNLQGIWQGSIRIKTFDRPYVFTIQKGAHDQWAAGVVIDDDWGIVWKADSISVHGDTIRFTIPFLGRPQSNTFEGTLSRDGKVLAGTWTAGIPAPLELERSAPATRWREASHTTRFVTVEKDVQVEVIDWGGTGRPLVMLPGEGLTAHFFSRLAAKLIPRYHVYGITRRGYGASSVPAIPAVPPSSISVVGPDTYAIKPLPNNPYDADRLGDDVVAVLTTLRIRRPVLVGHSIAGEELTSVASRYPDRVAGLIYLDAMAEFAFSDGQRYDALFTGEHPMKMRLPPGGALHLRVGDAVLLGMHEYREFPAVPGLAIFALPHHIEGLTGAAQIAFQTSQQNAVDRMNRIRPLLPTVRIVQFPEADHMVWESNEADVLREMTGFISELPK